MKESNSGDGFDNYQFAFVYNNINCFTYAVDEEDNNNALDDQQFDYTVGKDIIITNIIGADNNNILDVDHINNNSNATSLVDDATNHITNDYYDKSVYHLGNNDNAHNTVYDGHFNFLFSINNLIADARTKQLSM